MIYAGYSPEFAAANEVFREQTLPVSSSFNLWRKIVSSSSGIADLSACSDLRSSNELLNGNQPSWLQAGNRRGRHWPANLPLHCHLSQEKALANQCS